MGRHAARLSLHRPNQLSGTVPTEIGRLTQLAYLWLHTSFGHASTELNLINQTPAASSRLRSASPPALLRRLEQHQRVQLPVPTLRSCAASLGITCSPPPSPPPALPPPPMPPSPSPPPRVPVRATAGSLSTPSRNPRHLAPRVRRARPGHADAEQPTALSAREISSRLTTTTPPAAGAGDGRDANSASSNPRIHLINSTLSTHARVLAEGQLTVFNCTWRAGTTVAQPATPSARRLRSSSPPIPPPSSFMLQVHDGGSIANTFFDGEGGPRRALLQNGSLTLDGCTLHKLSITRGQGARNRTQHDLCCRLATALRVESGADVRLSNATAFLDCALAIDAAIGSEFITLPAPLGRYVYIPDGRSVGKQQPKPSRHSIQATATAKLPI